VVVVAQDQPAAAGESHRAIELKAGSIAGGEERDVTVVRDRARATQPGIVVHPGLAAVSNIGPINTVTGGHAEQPGALTGKSSAHDAGVGEKADFGVFAGRDGAGGVVEPAASVTG